MNHNNRVRTAAVGSWPVARSLVDSLRAFRNGEMSDSDCEPLLIEASRIAVQQQLDSGLDEISGGEPAFPDFVHDVPRRLSGLQCTRARSKGDGYAGVAHYAIVGDLGAPAGTGHALAFRREKKATPGLAKATVPSTLTMAIPFFMSDRLVDQLPNLAAIVKAEVMAMVDTGACEIQLDAPAEAVAAISGTFDVPTLLHWLLLPLCDVPDNVLCSVHLCLGDMRRRDGSGKAFTQEQNLRSLLPLIKGMGKRIGRIYLECSYAGQWEEHALLAQLPTHMQLCAGIGDVKQPQQQSVPDLTTMATQLLQYIPAHRLLLSASCGCGRLREHEAMHLNSSLSEAARLASAQSKL